MREQRSELRQELTFACCKSRLVCGNSCAQPQRPVYQYRTTETGGIEPIIWQERGRRPLLIFTRLGNVAQNSLMTPRMKPLTIQQAPHVCNGLRRVSSTLRQLKNYLSQANDLSAAFSYKALGVLKFCCKLINVSHSATWQPLVFAAVVIGHVRTLSCAQDSIAERCFNTPGTLSPPSWRNSRSGCPLSLSETSYEWPGRLESSVPP
jgi:DNA-directed RNA polymerase subunit N (RpoN/RPB10)